MFFDSNVVIDVVARDLRWMRWSAGWIERAADEGGGVIDAIVLAELSPGYTSLDDLLAAIGATSLRILDLDLSAAFLAGQTFRRWRGTRPAGADRRVLPDFLIGAHASILRLPLVTRDPAVYRVHYPDLILITPETHPDG